MEGLKIIVCAECPRCPSQKSAIMSPEMKYLKNWLSENIESTLIVTCCKQSHPRPNEAGRGTAAVPGASCCRKRFSASFLGTKSARGVAILLQAVEMDLIPASIFFNKAEGTAADFPSRFAGSCSLVSPRLNAFAVALAGASTSTSSSSPTHHASMRILFERFDLVPVRTGWPLHGQRMGGRVAHDAFVVARPIVWHVISPSAMVLGKVVSARRQIHDYVQPIVLGNERGNDKECFTYAMPKLCPSSWAKSQALDASKSRPSHPVPSGNTSVMRPV